MTPNCAASHTPPGHASGKELSAITAFGRALGLDVTQTSEKLGKDVAAKKATYPAVIGLEKSRSEARRLTSEAHSALKSLGESAAVLRTLADHLLQREY